jgi:type IV secretory pathway VirB2 component (pilin)
LVGLFALAALVLHALDLLSALLLMEQRGPSAELNPLGRAIMVHLGPLGLAVVKLGVVVLGLMLLVRLADYGRPRLAIVSLFLAASMGWLGMISNLLSTER